MSANSGTLHLKIDGNPFALKGSFTFGLGKPVREAQVGHNGVNGYKELPSAPYIEGEFQDTKDTSLDEISKVTDATITLELVNGKVYTFKNAWSCNPDGLGMGTEEGNIPVRFEALSGEEVR